MTEDRASARVVADRLDWVDRMLAELRSLPLDDHDAFFEDRRNLLAAESCLRRTLEALLDLGRHLLAKRFGLGISEYREIPQALYEKGVIDDNDAALFREMAGYRNRLVQYYHEVGAEDLYSICAERLPDVERVAGALRHWLQSHPEALDQSL